MGGSNAARRASSVSGSSSIMRTTRCSPRTKLMPANGAARGPVSPAHPEKGQKNERKLGGGRGDPIPGQERCGRQPARVARAVDVNLAVYDASDQIENSSINAPPMQFNIAA